MTLLPEGLLACLRNPTLSIQKMDAENIASFPKDDTPNTALPLYAVFSELEIKFIVQLNKYMWYCISVVSNKYS